MTSGEMGKSPIHEFSRDGWGWFYMDGGCIPFEHYSLVYANESLIKGVMLFVDPNSVASLIRPNYVGQ